MNGTGLGGVNLGAPLPPPGLGMVWPGGPRFRRGGRFWSMPPTAPWVTVVEASILTFSRRPVMSYRPGVLSIVKLLENPLFAPFLVNLAT